MPSSDRSRPSEASDLTLLLLGKRGLMRNGSECAVHLPERVWELLGLLAVHRGEHLARRELATTIWPDVSEEAGLANLRRHLHVATQALEACDPHPWFNSDRHSVWWSESPEHRCDLHEFIEHHAAGNFNRAAKSYSGELLPGLYSEWIEPFRQRIDRLALEALSNVADGGDTAEALAAAERILTIDPYDEPALRRVLTILSTRGERTTALIRYQSFAMTLMVDLHAKPSEETQHLHARLASEATQNHSADALSVESSIIGRAADVARVNELLETGAAVTLVGPGGVGKTRLALEIAFGRRALSEHHVAFVDFAPLREGDNLAAHVLEKLGTSSGTGEELQAIRAATVSQNVLLVLDNCERVARPAGELVEALAEVDSLRILATSRRALGNSRETCYRVEPLAFPVEEEETVTVARHPAVGLLLLRASEASPGLIVDAQAKRHAQSIVRSLDGLPFAIEIAASRAGSLSLADIDRLLSKTLDLSFPKPSPLLMPHQTSLRNALDWSLSLLNEPARRLLPKLVVFPDSWDIDAANAICAADTSSVDFIDVIGELIDLSFVTRRSSSGTTRFSLPETVRRYVSDRLDAHSFAELQERHAQHYLARASALTDLRGSAGMLAYMTRLRPDSKNLLKALRYFAKRKLPINASTIAYALAWYWRRTGFTKEGLKIITAALAEARAEDPSYGLMYRTAGTLAVNAGQWHAAAEYNERAERLLSSIGNHTRAIEARLAAQQARGYLGADLKASIALGEQAVHDLHELGEEVVEAEATAFVALLHFADGNLEVAQSRMLKALAIFRARGQTEWEATTCLQLCPVYVALGLVDEGLQCATYALRVFREIGDLEQTAHSLTRLGELNLEAGDIEAARCNLREAVTLLQRAHDPRQIIRTLSAAAELFAAQGDARESARTLGYGLHLERLVGQSPMPLAHARASLISSLRATFGNDFDAITELGSILTLRAVEEALVR